MRMNQITEALLQFEERCFIEKVLDEGQLIVAVFDEVSQRGIDCDLGCAGKALFVAQHINDRTLGSVSAQIRGRIGGQRDDLDTPA